MRTYREIEDSVILIGELQPGLRELRPFALWMAEVRMKTFGTRYRTLKKIERAFDLLPENEKMAAMASASRMLVRIVDEYNDIPLHHLDIVLTHVQGESITW